MKFAFSNELLSSFYQNDSYMSERLRSFMKLTRLNLGLHTVTDEETFAVSDAAEPHRDVIKALEPMGFQSITASSTFVQLIRPSSEHHTIDAIAEIRFDASTVGASCAGSPFEVDAFMGWARTYFEPIGASIRIASSLDAQRNIRYSYAHLSLEGERQAYQSFYPWLSVDLEDYFDAFMESDEAVLIMFGPPGTGKSTFLRSLINHRAYDATLAYAPDVVSAPEVLNEFYSSRNRILAYEDIDEQMKPREDGNSLMAVILNSTEGVVRRPGKKIVFSTNLPSVDKIDPALLRVGRCFDILEFGLLTSEQALDVARDLKLNGDTDFSAKDKWSLAEVMSQNQPKRQTMNRMKRNKAGFY